MCFGARLMRGNRVQKVHSSAYRAFDSLTYPPLATLGVDVEWAYRNLLQVASAGTLSPAAGQMCTEVRARSHRGRPCRGRPVGF